MNRRHFFKWAGLSASAGTAAAFGTTLLAPLHPALAQTWQRLTGTASGGGGAPRLVRTPTRSGGARLQNVVSGGRAIFMIALGNDGRVYSVGDNTSGRLGINLGDTNSRSTFVQALGVSNAISIAAGGAFGIALRSDGLVFATGSNTGGQLGLNDTVSRSTYAQVLGLSSVVRIEAGTSHALALRADGLVFTCGTNSSGQLGDGTSTSRLTYVQAVGISNAVAIAGGWKHSAVIRSDGLVFTSGSADSGELGVNLSGTGLSRNTFAQAIGISNAIAVSCGSNLTLALRSDGFVFGAGSNDKGQLGTNNTTSRATFVQALSISNIIAIAAGNSFAGAIRSDGLVFTAGSNEFGQLGAGLPVGISGGGSRSVYVQAIGISNAVAIACGASHVAVLRNDGKLFAAGANAKGQLSINLGSTASQSTFVQTIGP